VATAFEPYCRAFIRVHVEAPLVTKVIQQFKEPQLKAEFDQVTWEEGSSVIDGTLARVVTIIMNQELNMCCPNHSGDLSTVCQVVLSP
jgi:hypothetical protein